MLIKEMEAAAGKPSELAACQGPEGLEKWVTRGSLLSTEFRAFPSKDLLSHLEGWEDVQVVDATAQSGMYNAMTDPAIRPYGGPFVEYIRQQNSPCALGALQLLSAAHFVLCRPRSLRRFSMPS
jgi:hypothetical protein